MKLTTLYSLLMHPIVPQTSYYSRLESLNLGCQTLYPKRTLVSQIAMTTSLTKKSLSSCSTPMRKSMWVLRYQGWNSQVAQRNPNKKIPMHRLYFLKTKVQKTLAKHTSTTRVTFPRSLISMWSKTSRDKRYKLLRLTTQSHLTLTREALSTRYRVAQVTKHLQLMWTIKLTLEVLWERWRIVQSIQGQPILLFGTHRMF